MGPEVAEKPHLVGSVMKALRDLPGTKETRYLIGELVATRALVQCDALHRPSTQHDDAFIGAAEPAASSLGNIFANGRWDGRMKGFGSILWEGEYSIDAIV
jgi:hypothetical protein